MEKEVTSQSSLKIKSADGEGLNKTAEQAIKIDRLEEFKNEVHAIKTSKDVVQEIRAESEFPIKVLPQGSLKNKRDLGKKEDEENKKFKLKMEVVNLLQEKVEKESFSIPKTSEVQKIVRDIRKTYSGDILCEQDELVPTFESINTQKSENKLKIKKEFKSNIPVSLSKTEKDRSLLQKQNKIGSIQDVQSEHFSKPPIKGPNVSDPGNKAEIESRIPKRVLEKSLKKEFQTKKEHHRMEKVTKEEVTSTNKKSETHIFSKTFIAQPQDAIKMFEDINALKNEPEVVVTSIIDQEASTTREKIETTSSEISKGRDTFLLEEKKEDHKSNKISEKFLKKQFSEKLIEEKEAENVERSKSAFQNTVINRTSEKQIVDTSASQAMIQNKTCQRSTKLENKERIIKEVEDSSKMKESKIDIGMRIETDLLNLQENITDVTADEYFHKTESNTFDAKNISKVETHPTCDQTMTKLEAQHIAESLVQSIEKELEKSPISSDCIKKEFEEPEQLDSEGSDNQLADDLTKKFQNIMGKSICQENIELGFSIQEEMLEKDYTQDSVSVSEDLAKDDDSYLQDKEGLSSSRFHVTLSSSSMSDHIDLEDAECFAPESDILKPRKYLVSEISDARVLEIFEPEQEICQKFNVVEKSLMKIDDDKCFELNDTKDLTDIINVNNTESSESTSARVSTLHESVAADALDKMCQESNSDLKESSNVVLEETNVSEFPPIRSYTESNIRSKKGDSFEIHSPPLISPRLKVKDLEIKPLNWMIGEEKIEISETLQPFQVFNKELEEYHSTIKEDSKIRVSDACSIDDGLRKGPEQSINVQDRVTQEELPMFQDVKSKFTVTKVSDEELEGDNLEANYQEYSNVLEKQEVLQRESVDSISNKEENMSSEKQELIRTGLQDYSSKESTESYFDVKSDGNTTGRSHIQDHRKLTEKGDKILHDPNTLKTKKEDLQNVNLSAKYSITVLDQVVKKEIAEVKESLQAAKQDLIEELSENNEVLFNIKDSPSEFQFKLQPESIPNELPFLYRTSSSEKGSDQDSTPISGSPIIKPKWKSSLKDKEENSEISAADKKDLSLPYEETSWDYSGEKQNDNIIIDKDQLEGRQSTNASKDASLEEFYSTSPVPASRSISDTDNKDDSFSLQPPQPAPRKRLKPTRPKKIIHDSEPESSGESNYQSCDYEIGSGSRPSSSDFDTMQSAFSGTLSEYETAMMSMEHSRPTSQDYQTAANTLSSRESMKSLNSLSSGHLGSVDSTSELSETLVPSETEMDEKDVIDEGLEIAFDDDQVETNLLSETVSSKITTDTDIPCKMKRSSEMIFPQLSKDSSVEDNSCRKSMDVDVDSKQELEKSRGDKLNSKLDEEIETQIEKMVDVKSDSSTSTNEIQHGILESVDIITTRISQQGIQSVCTQVISRETDSAIDDAEEQAMSFEPDSLDQRLDFIGPDDENGTLQTSTRTWLQQASMSTSSTSGMSMETVVEKDTKDRNSPDSDSFELVDKPDIMDDFVVIEEVGKEAEEFDSEGKSIKISSFHGTTVKTFDRDVENLITEKDEKEVPTSQASKNNELFDFESEESPPQASHDEQYSQSYSDEEPDESGKKWIEMQFQSDARLYDTEYERGPLEDIKEEEITDFEPGSSKFGSMGSQKESVGSVGSMRGSFGSTPDYETVIGKKYFIKPTDHDNVSLSSLQEFEHLENAVAMENSKKFSSGSQDSGSNGSLPKRYTSRSGHGDDISLSSLKDFEGLEKACKEAHLIELRAKEEEDLLDHESPENKFKLETLTKTRPHINTYGSANQSTSSSDDYEKRIKEIDEIIRIAQANVEKLEKQDDTTEDISQIEVEKGVAEVDVSTTSHLVQETNIMETSTDSLELEDNLEMKQNLMCRSSDSLELKTTLDLPSLSSDSLNNMRDPKDMVTEIGGNYISARRISSDSLEIPERELQEPERLLKDNQTSSNRPEESTTGVPRLLSYATNKDKTNSSSSGGI